jgi:NAD(P)-dependent dehydrogenase (short-subunit alcohol dehydrogenase family)
VNELGDSVALITGGGGGIGAATASALAARGADIVLMDISEARTAAVADQLSASGTRVGVVIGDLSDDAERERMVTEAIAAHGSVHHLINAAGVALWPEHLFEVTRENWDRTLLVNLTVPFELTRSIARQMIEQGIAGRIVNVSSIAAAMARGPIAYGTAKAGLLGLTRLTAGQLARHDINVNAVAPTITLTDMVRDRQGDDQTQRDVNDGAIGNLLKRPNEPGDVAAAIEFLCLPSSRQITGQTLFVDGGTVFS